MAGKTQETAPGNGAASESMFDRDRIFGGLRLDIEFNDDEPFVLWDCGIIAENVVIGDDNMPPATKSGLVVTRLRKNSEGKFRPDGDPFTVGTFGQAIADKVRRKSGSELPAVVKTHVVEASNNAYNDARVLTFLRELPDEIAREYLKAYDGETPTFGQVKALQDDIPF